ncbi:putative ribonuclease H-like domain-containing protein [Tanacetum coccineum]
MHQLFEGSVRSISRSVLVTRENEGAYGCILGTKACDDVGKARVEIKLGKDYILLPLWTQDLPFSSSLKNSLDVGFKPSREEEKKDAEDPGNESGNPPEGKDSEVPKDNAVDENIVYGCADDPNIPDLEEIGRFSDAEDDGAEADMTNLDTHIPVSIIPTTRIHKDHPVEQIIGDIHSAPQTRRMTKSVIEHVMFSSVQQRTNHKDFQNFLFACFLSQAEPKKVIQALKDRRWIEVIQDELLQFKLQQVWTLVDLPHGKRAIGTKWVYRNKKDERGNMIKNKARLAAQGIEAIRLFLSYASFKEFVVYQIDVKSAFLYGKIEEEVHVCQPPGFEGPDFPDRKGQIDKTLFIKRDKGDILLVQVYVDEHLFQVNPNVSHLYAVKRIFRYLKGQPKLGLWYPKDSPFNLVAFTDSDYAGASLDKKSTTGGCQFLGCRLISWQCKKQTVVANSTTEAKYIAASNCCGQVLWIQNQMLDYGYNFLYTKIYIDNKSIICIVKNLVFYSKTKHIEIRHHFIKDFNEKKLIQMIKIQTDQNVTNLLTKAFDRIMHKGWLKWNVTTAKDGIGVNTGNSRVNVVGHYLVLRLLNANPIRYALTLSPTIYVSCIKQFWSTAKTKTINNETQIHAKVEGKAIVISESSVRRHLQFDDEDDETITKEREDRMERVATTTSSLEAEQDSGNINKTQSMEILNESSPQGTGSGSGPRWQDTILGDAEAQTRFETASKPSNERPLSRVNTLGSGEDRLKLKELMELCTKLSDRVLDLETTKTA